MNFNKAIVLGNLTRDPEVRTLPSGQPVASFAIATNRIYLDKNGAKQQATEFHNIVTFGKLADICSRYLTKGSLALIEGRIQTRTWLDQSGVKKYRTEIVAEAMQMGPRRDAGSQQPPTAPNNAAVDNPPRNEEIPVIDVDEQFSESSSENQSGEIDMKNIPF